MALENEYMLEELTAEEIYQKKLTAGANITINNQNVISATGGGSSVQYTSNYVQGDILGTLNIDGASSAIRTPNLVEGENITITRNQQTGAVTISSTGGSGDLSANELTEEAYNALTPAEKTNGDLYLTHPAALESSEPNKIYYNNTLYGTEGGNDVVELTQAEWDALPNSKLTDGIIYVITDSGGGGTSAGVSKIETLRGRTYTEKRQSNVTPFSLLGNILTSTASSQTNSVANIQSVQKIDVTSIDYFIITVFSLKGIANPYYPYIWLDDSDHSNDDYPTVSSKMQFTSTVNNYTVYVWDVSALTGEKYFGICTGVHTEFILSVEQSGTPQVVLQPIIYSEEEREVGVWIDNKPLYQKTIDVGQLPNNSTKSITIDANIDLIVNYEGFMYSTVDRKSQRPLPMVGNTNDVRIDKNGANLRVITYADWTTYNGYVNIIYTKTTDSAGSGSYNTLGVPTVHYTTDEQVIGTYLGKPLYQKSIIGTFANGSKTLTLPIYEQDIITVTNYEVVVFPSNDASSSVVISTDRNQSPYCYFNSVTGYGIIKNTGIIITRPSADIFGYTPKCVFTVQYTKTTD